MSNADTPARRQSQPPAERPRPQRELTKAEVQEQIRRRRASIDGHIDGLKRELVASGEEVQQDAEQAIQQNMTAVLGGLALAGAVTGYWLVRRRKKRRARVSHGWGPDYLDAIGEQVRAAVERGEDASEAARRFAERRGPIVIHERGAAPAERRGLLRTVISLAGRTLVSTAVAYAVGQVTDQFSGGDDAGQAEETPERTASVSGAASD